MTTDDHDQDHDHHQPRADVTRHRLVTLALSAAALGLATATLALDVLRDETGGTSPLLTLAVVVLALNGLRAVEHDGGG